MMDQGYSKFTLPNGVRILTIPMNGVNSVATSVMVGVGSRNEDSEINGISHFIEHLTFKGTKKYPTTDDVNIVEQSGGLQNAYTDIDITNYHNKVLAEDWELGLDVNKELALRPLFEDKHIDLERNVIIEEMKRYEDEPTAKLEETFHNQMYPGTRLGMRIIGTVDSLGHCLQEVIRKYHDRWYSADRLVVVAAGKLSAENLKRIRDKAAEWFGSERIGDKQLQDAVSVKQDKPHLEVITKPQAQQAHLELGFRTFARSSPERYAWSVFNILMGVSFTSRLFREIREKRGLCYHIRSSSGSWTDTGYWSVYAGVATEKVDEAIKAILDQLVKVREAGVTDAEVGVAKKRIKTLLAFKSEDPEFLNEYYGRQEVFNEPVETVDEYVAKIEAVTPEDISILLKKYIVQKTLNLALVWNKSQDDGLSKLLVL